MKVKNEYGHRFVFVPNNGRDLERRVEFPVGETVEISQETYRAMQVEKTPRGWFSPDDKGRSRLVIVAEPAPEAAPPAGDVRPKK